MHPTSPLVLLTKQVAPFLHGLKSGQGSTGVGWVSSEDVVTPGNNDSVETCDVMVDSDTDDAVTSVIPDTVVAVASELPVIPESVVEAEPAVDGVASVLEGVGTAVTWLTVVASATVVASPISVSLVAGVLKSSRLVSVEEEGRVVVDESVEEGEVFASSGRGGRGPTFISHSWPSQPSGQMHSTS